MADIKHTVDVFESVDYDKFAYYLFNRDMINHGKKLIAAISVHNLLKEFPIKCRIEADGKLYILDGQGRFYAAKELKIPIFYELIVDQSPAWELIIRLNSNSTSFKTLDYIKSGVKTNSAAYITLYGYINQFPSIEMDRLLSFIGVSKKQIKDGTFANPVLPSDKLRVLTTVNEISESMIDDIKSFNIRSTRKMDINRAVLIWICGHAIDAGFITQVKSGITRACSGDRSTSIEKFFGKMVLHS
jgi:hypothetical protein